MSRQFGDLRSVVKTAQEKHLTITFLEQLKFCVQIATGRVLFPAPYGWSGWALLSFPGGGAAQAGIT